MHGIVSLLDAVHHEKVEGIWTRLEDHCGLRGVRVTPIPHFSWQVAPDYDFEALRPALEELAGKIPPFVVRTTGLGIFTGVRDIVLYISLVKDENLWKVHQGIWNTAVLFAREPVAYYAPENWMPHITLGHGDVDEEGLGCAARLLGREDFNWEIYVDHLLLVYQPEGATGVVMNRYRLGKVI